MSVATAAALVEFSRLPRRNWGHKRNADVDDDNDAADAVDVAAANAVSVLALHVTRTILNDNPFMFQVYYKFSFRFVSSRFDNFSCCF